MKNSAIIRIVIWSLVIVILLGLLLAGLGIEKFWGSRFYRFNSPAIAATEATGVRTTDTLPSGTYTATAAMNVREIPSDEATITGTLNRGDTVTVERSENANGLCWALISSPAKGWVQADCLEGSADASVPADQVKKIAIDWVSGTVTIQPGDVTEISFHEDSSKYPMVWKLHNGKLTIQFCQKNKFGYNLTVNKDLTILVPKDFALDELELDAASADLNASDIAIRSVNLNTASGTSHFQDCDVTDLDIDTASGDVFFEGSLDTLDFDAASASFSGILTNTPSRIDVDSASGDLDLTLPEDTGFSVDLDGMSCDFSSEFETTLRNGRHTYGDGHCRIDMDGISSDVIIRKGIEFPVTVPSLPDALDAPTVPSSLDALVPQPEPIIKTTTTPSAPDVPDAP